MSEILTAQDGFRQKPKQTQVQELAGIVAQIQNQTLPYLGMQVQSIDQAVTNNSIRIGAITNLLIDEMVAILMDSENMTKEEAENVMEHRMKVEESRGITGILLFQKRITEEIRNEFVERTDAGEAITFDKEFNIIPIPEQEKTEETTVINTEDQDIVEIPEK